MNSITFQKDLLGVQNDLLRFAYKLTSTVKKQMICFRKPH